MEQHLISITTLDRVKADPNEIVRLRVQLRNGNAHVLLLGRKGSMHQVPDENKYSHDQMMKAAQEGLLYTERRKAWAFAPGLDPDTELPVLLERYEDAFRRRQLDNTAPEPAQQKMDLNPAAKATTT